MGAAVGQDDSTLKHFNKIKGVSKSGFEEAHRAIADKGLPPMSHSRLGPGYVIKGAIANFIRAGSQRKTGNRPNQSTVEYARKFLRLSHNMVALDRVDTYTFEIFVRAKWNDYDSVLPLVYQRNDRSEDWYERRLTPEEAGETMPAGEVETRQAPYRCKQCSAGFETHSLLGSHIANKHPASDEYECKHCGKTFTKSQSLASHTSSQHPKASRGMTTTRGQGTRPRDRICEKCQQYFTPQGLGKHAPSCDGDKKPERDKGKTMPSANGGSVKISEVVPELRWKSTEQWDAERKEYVCVFRDCRRGFSTWNGLARHKERHLGEVLRDMLAERPTEQKVADVEGLSDDQLLDEFAKRLKDKPDPQQVTDAENIRQRHEIIRSLINDVNQGNMAPLKALSEIEAALDL